MKNFIPGTMAIATLGIVISFALPAVAEGTLQAATPETGTGIRTVSIQYAPTELATDSGRTKLYAMIKHAAREVCGPTGLWDAGSLAMASRNRRCADQAVSAAMAQVNPGRLANAGH